jgi:predicted homoserine dehydrogenase-like protein
VLRNEPTGCSKEFRGDAVATAKRDLKPGEMLDDGSVSRPYCLKQALVYSLVALKVTNTP